MASTDTDGDEEPGSSPVDDNHEAPDGGWAWVICFSCFVIQGILGGMVYSFGLLYVELLDYFQRPKGETAWVLSIFQGVSFLGGPLYSAVVSRLGCRLASSVGSLLLAAGFILSAWAPSLYFLFFSIGVLGGLGFGTVYLASMVCISQYFNNRRSLATGIAISGVGIGTLAMGPALKMLMETYTWKGAVLLQGGINLQCLVFSLFYRPLSEYNRNGVKRTTNATGTEIHTSADSDVQSKVRNYERNIGSPDERIPIFKIKETEHYFSSQKGLEIIIERNEGEISSMESEAFICRNHEDGDNQISKQDQKDHQSSSNNQRKTNSDTDIPLSSDYQSGNPANGVARKGSGRGFRMDVYKELIKNLPFVSLLAAACLTWLCYVVPYMYIVDTARTYNIDSSESAWFISSMGVANTVGRALCGALGSLRFVNRHYLYMWTLIAAGGAAIAIPLSHVFASMLCFGIIYGLISGGTITLSMVRLVDLVKTSHCSEAIGLHSAASGIALFLGPPFAGWLFDVTGTYLATYLFAGISSCCAGFIMSCVPCLTDKLASRK